MSTTIPNNQPLYTPERYLAVLRRFKEPAEARNPNASFLAEDIDLFLGLEPGVEPEIKSLEEADVLDSRFYSGQNAYAYSLADENYMDDMLTIGRYLDSRFNGDMRRMERELNEKDLEHLLEETEVVEILV